MGKIKEYIFGLPTFVQLIIYVVALLIISEILSGFFGKTYSKGYPNEQSYVVAVKEFRKACGKYHKEIVDDGEEYTAYFESKREAIRAFTKLSRNLDKEYSNGTFLHCYLSGKERIYQCLYRRKQLIAVRYYKQRALPSWGEWRPSYQIQMYIEK